MSRVGKDAMSRGNDLIKQSIENLKLISEYKMDLVDFSGDVVADMSNTAYRIQSSTVNYHNTFNEDDPINWDIDPNKVSDIEDERDV
jgi:hypothetical protein